MVRLQVQLTERQIKALKNVSATTGQSVAELIRQGVDRYLSGRDEISREERVERAVRAAGRFSSGRSDVSAKHDRYLADALAQ